MLLAEMLQILPGVCDSFRTRGNNGSLVLLSQILMSPLSHSCPMGISALALAGATARLRKIYTTTAPQNSTSLYHLSYLALHRATNSFAHRNDTLGTERPAEIAARAIPLP